MRTGILPNGATKYGTMARTRRVRDRPELDLPTVSYKGCLQPGQGMNNNRKKDLVTLGTLI